MFIYGVVNASPDSLELESIVASETDALDRSRGLIADGADGIDIEGQGSTDNAEVVDWETEWARVDTVINSVAKLGVEVSIDSWRPEVVERALQAGATVINAADGMQSERMWEVASNFNVPIVVPFLSGQNPREMSIVKTDPIKAMKDFFSHRLEKAKQYSLEKNCILDPGTGFAPSNWEWSERFEYQKYVYSNLGKLRDFSLPLYVALPWKETPDHDELLEIVLKSEPEYARAHFPGKVRQVEKRLKNM